ncbi:MAG TPA: response regulator [Thermoleophilaceae bacterium]|jgi:CheY-like chemotaxis protein
MALILVVQDRPPERERLIELLGAAAYAVIWSEDGHDAVRQVRERRPAVVIADMLVPEMDGLEFARAVRADPEISKTPIVLCTATYEPRELERLALAAGVTRVLVQPVEPKEILRAVAELQETELAREDAAS